MSKYNGVVIADIHVGAMNLDKTFTEYQKIFLDNISKMKNLDFVIICGDFFDHKFFLQDKGSIQSYIMLRDLVILCKEKNAKLRIVYGTESHECNQYDLFSILDLYNDIKIIKQVEEEYLFDDLCVLYLPEEYIYNKNEYYKDYLGNKDKYDYVFGHGVIKEVMTEASLQLENKTKDNKRKHVPVFNSSELSYICKGQVYFGHYHVNSNIDDKIFYIGSFSRWKFGEEERKGFYKLKYDNNKYNNEFIENTLSDSYNTISISYNDINTENIDNTMDVINNIHTNVFDHVRYIINIPNDTDNPESFLKLLKENNKYDDNVKIEVVHGYIEEKRKHEKERVKEENEKYIFIRDKNIPMEDKVSTFIKIEYNRDVIPSDVFIYLNYNINEILQRMENHE